MAVTRREFLSCAAASAAAFATRSRVRHQSLGDGSVLLDLGEQCALRESLAGYRSTLAEPRTVTGSVLIVPAALRITGAAGRRIARCVEDGGTLILESGAIFAAPASRDFREHRDALRDLLGLQIEAPRRFPRERMRVPYVEFRWPTSVLLRDFGAIVPVGAHNDDCIACVEDTTVALARRRGRGMLIFLGSPIGPALWVGDAEARRWLHEVLRRSSPA